MFSPDVFGQLAVEDLQHRIGDQLDLVLFQDLEAAQAWLQAQ